MDVSWGIVALVLSALAAVWTWVAFRRRGLASGVRGIALVLLPIAAWLTGTLRLVGRVADAVADWALRFVFSPSVWTGIAIAGVAVILLFVSAKLPNRAREAKVGSGAAPSGRRAVSSGADGGVRDTLGDDTDDIEAILRKHGIS